MKVEFTGFSIADMLLLVGMQGRTGELILEAGNNIGTMLFHQGRILQAFSPYSRAIGDLLVEDGMIDDMELLETLKHQKKSSAAPIGSLLMKNGKVTFEVVEMMVHEQIRAAVKEFRSWKGPTYSFLDKDIQPYDTIHLTVHEFMAPGTLQAAANFLSASPNS